VSSNQMIRSSQLKQLCTSFYYWWHNQPGSNTEQGFEEWIARPDVQAMLTAAPEVEPAHRSEQPAPEAQGEPVAYLRKDQLRKVQRMGPMLGEIAASPRVDRVPVYVAPQPATEAALLEAFVAETAAQAEAAELAVALEEIAQWVDRWASADHPVATVARKALAGYRKQGGEP
jgi:hypothetical protein